MKQWFREQKQSLGLMLTIFLCFFLTSTGYLAWLYHLIEAAPAGVSDLLALGLGYLLQAAGIGTFAFTAYKKPALAAPKPFVIVLALYIACMIPSVLAKTLLWTAVFGGLANFFCGMIAGWYLYYLRKADPRHRALTFGIGYGLSTFASWILALIGNGALYHSNAVLYILGALAILAAVIFLRFHQPDEDALIEEAEGKPAGTSKLLTAACAVVFLFSVVNQIGFSFPSADLANGVSLESSRLFYAAGLIIAGFVSDRSRQHGAVVTLGALIIPFIMLVLRREVIPATILWALSYFASGFFSVYRVILFVDIAQEKHLWFLSGFGLLFGRLGEAIGATVFASVTGSSIMPVVLAGALYAVTVALFFWLYQKLYMPHIDEEKAERLRFQRFAIQHDLSPREKEILSLLLAKETTADIAQQLYVSESTVKFHVHNLLQKTGCKNRKELADLFYGK